VVVKHGLTVSLSFVSPVRMPRKSDETPDRYRERCIKKVNDGMSGTVLMNMISSFRPRQVPDVGSLRRDDIQFPPRQVPDVGSLRRDAKSAFLHRTLVYLGFLPKCSMTDAGLEPAIFCFVGRRLIRLGQPAAPSRCIQPISACSDVSSPAGDLFGGALVSFKQPAAAGGGRSIGRRRLAAGVGIGFCCRLWF